MDIIKVKEIVDMCIIYNSDLKPTEGNAAIYARESMGGSALKKQIDELTTKAEAIGESTYTVYGDVGINNDENLPELSKMLNDIADKQYTRVYVSHLNRISRDIEKLYEFVNGLHSGGIEIVALAVD